MAISPLDHPFDPRGKWWTLCKHCGFAQAAHNSSTPEAYAAKAAHFATLPRSEDRIARERAAERERVHSGGRARIGYYADDNPDEE